MRQWILTLLLTILLHPSLMAQQALCITGYYAGPASKLDQYPISKLTHLIYSFGHLQGNKLHISDTDAVKKMVAFKKKYPRLKIILSMGGWSGCEYCSPVFSKESGRKEFSHSVKKYLDYFKADGIDLDWEYPGIAGYPGHAFSPKDKKNFTFLIENLRQSLGEKYEISFAAGGFDAYIDSSIEWKKVMRLCDKVYIMSYDLVHGYSKVSGHHTPLYSTPEQIHSTDHAVKRLLAEGVPSEKIVIGAAFYGRLFSLKDTLNRGLYRPCTFYHAISYSAISDSIQINNGFHSYWDEIAQAPYAIHVERKLLFTYDDSLSVAKKTNYAIQNHLGGIMFWQLADDKTKNGLLDVMDQVKQRAATKKIRE